MKKGNPHPKPPSSRTGIPAKESFWLPPHDSTNVKNKSIDKKVRWEIEQVIEHIFPKQYQKVYNSVATLLIKAMSEKQVMFPKDIGVFRDQNQISKATLYNKVIPRLKQAGVLTRERDLNNNRMFLKLSLTFSNYLSKIAEEWESFVSTARMKYKQDQE